MSDTTHDNSPQLIDPYGFREEAREAREHVATLMSRLSWLSGAASTAGVDVPPIVQTEIDRAVAFLGGQRRSPGGD